VKLHLGCGGRYIPGWTHIDVLPYPHVEYRHSVDRLPSIRDGEAEVVYACHVLEHFQEAEVEGVLREWRRVLKPGGILRVAVPDFAALCELYQEIGDLGLVQGPVFGRQDYLYNIHHSVWDESKMGYFLNLAGFTRWGRYDWRETEHADLDDYSQSYYPHMDKEHGKLLSLNVEAVR